MQARDLAVVVVAAGRGERLGEQTPKAFVEVAGKSILEHSLEPIAKLAELLHVVIVVPSGYASQAEVIAQRVLGDDVAFYVGFGGETRQQSIANALSALNPDAQIVLVHDAARAFATTALFETVASEVRKTRHSVIPALDVADTIKRVHGDEVLETVDRASLRSAQTPQGFIAQDLFAAYSAATSDFTDDAALMQSLGKKVRFVVGEESARKITNPADLAWANSRFGGEHRTGIGVDAHRFSEDADKKLYLGTLEWPGERGLEGHSDGDAVSHAIVDALLAAAKLGDIGSNFGVDRAAFAGANGQVFLEETLRMLSGAGFSVVNVSVELIGNRPRVSARRAEVEARLSEILGAPVSFAATTTDGLGFLGSDEGIAAVASALLSKSTDRLTP